MLLNRATAAALCLTSLLFPICGTLHTHDGEPSSLALYQEPPAIFKESSTPRLNSIIVKSKPYTVNDSLQLLHQALDGKTWRREVPVTLITSTTNMDDTTVTTQATTSGQELATYLMDCSEDKTCTEATTPGPTFKPYSQEELDKFLQKASATGVQQTSPRTGDLEESDQPTNKLANLYIEDEAVNILETTPEPGGSSSSHDKSKSWNLVSSQTHKHPYDDRNGWVSLEPIPWSLSQIQKWEPNPNTRPQIPSWSSSSSSSSSSTSYQHSPGWSSVSSSSRPPQSEYGKPSWVKPTYDYRPQESYHKPSSWSQASPKPSLHGPPPGWGGASGDIITDGHPGYFPSEKPGYQEQGSSASFHRPQVIYKDQYNGPQSNSAPIDGDGRWVLLSSTKGYSFPPQRQRSTGRRALRLEAPEENVGSTFESVPLKPAMKSRRTVRLTVLPPLEGSANTTTSHGGLLEVEKTSETVEESQRAYAARMLKLQTLEAEAYAKEPVEVRPKPEKLQTNRTGSQRNVRAERRLGTTMRVVPNSRAQSSNNARNNAVLAAVGAGMIPATVAMLLPMVLGRKRRKRETHYEPVPLTVVETPHRRRRKPVKKIIVRKKPTEVVYY